MLKEEREVRDGTLTIQVATRHSTRTLALSGELDLASAETLAAELRDAEGNGVSLIQLDLSDLAFIDSTGIAVLVAAHHRLTSGDGKPGLEVVPSRASEVQRVMSLTGLDTELPFVDRE